MNETELRQTLGLPNKNKKSTRGAFLDTSHGNRFTTVDGSEYISVNGTIYKLPKQSTKKLSPSKLARKAARSSNLRQQQQQSKKQQSSNPNSL